MLAAYLSENKEHNWVSGLPYIQAAKNNRYHSGIGRSPYEALFGIKMLLGISNDNIPKEEIDKIETEEDLEHVFNVNNQSKTNATISFEEESTERIYQDETIVNENSVLENIPEAGPSSSNQNRDHIEAFSFIDYGETVDNIARERAGARAFQKKQAEKMLNRSNKK